MSWKSGSGLMGEIIEFVEDLVPNYKTRVELYKGFIEAFENHDCDTLDECVDESTAFKEAMKEVHPTHFDDEESFREEYDD